MRHKKRALTIMSVLVLILSVSVGTGYGKSDSATGEADYQMQAAALNVRADDLSMYITEHQEILNSINNGEYLTANDFEVQDYVIENVTVGINSYKNSSLGLENQKDHAELTAQGYTAKGVTSFAIENAVSGGQNQTFCVMNRYYMDGNSICTLVRNTNTNNPAIIDIHCYVLYVKG